MDLNTLLDERAIYLQICALADAMDQRDWSALDHILTKDADGDFGTGERIVGRAGFVSLFTHFLGNCGPTQHLIGNVRVNVNGDTAESRCYIRDMHIGSGARAHLFMSSSGEYLDRWNRTPEGWRMTHRTKKTPIITGTLEALGIGKPD